ncbi:trimeric intracellular cation channel family protein [Kitasatospora griseola]|uniref:trimeric intracellular cation channel family protein n=1 Tax=Kitasatospora griseola TaxID=2064 RepID=UPI003806205A
MTSEIFPHDVQQILDLVGIFVFALSGGLMAVRKNMDIFGICVLAEATALGGGVLRDLVIGALPVAAFTNSGYFPTPLVAGVVVFFLHPEVERITRAVMVLDAAGLGLFAVTGTIKAHDYGLGAVASVACGMLTAAGGGVVRDVLAMEPPSLLRWDREIYAVPALIGAAITALLIGVGQLTPVSAALAAVAAFTVRMLALKYGWRAPRAWHRNGSRTSEE